MGPIDILLWQINIVEIIYFDLSTQTYTYSTMIQAIGKGLLGWMKSLKELYVFSYGFSLEDLDFWDNFLS